MKKLLSACVALVVLGQASIARAGDPAAAEALFRDARDAVKRGDYATACPKFAESHRLDPAAGTLLNLARCEENIGRPAAAWEHYRQAIDLLPAGDARRGAAEREAQRVSARVPKLVVVLGADAPASTIVLRDGVEFGAASFGTPIPVEPGKHVLVVKAPGRADRSITVIAVEGETQRLVADPGPEESRTGEQRVSIHHPESDRAERGATSGASHRKTVGFVAGGVGLVGVAVGTVFALRASSKNDEALDHCTGTTCRDQVGVDLTSESRTASKVSIAAFIVGGLSLATGAALVLSSPKSGNGSVSATPLLSQEVIGMGARCTW